MAGWHVPLPYCEHYREHDPDHNAAVTAFEYAAGQWIGVQLAARQSVTERALDIEDCLWDGSRGGWGSAN
jgi:hypothetical protein